MATPAFTGISHFDLSVSDVEDPCAAPWCQISQAAARPPARSVQGHDDAAARFGGQLRRRTPASSTHRTPVNPRTKVRLA